MPEYGWRSVARRGVALRVRVTGAATIAVALALVIAGWGLIEAQRREQTRQLDREARAALSLIAAIVADGPPPKPLPTARDSLLLCQVVDSEGVVIAYNPNAMELPPMAQFTVVDGPDGTVQRRSGVVQSASSYEYFTNVTRDGERFAVYVAAPVRPIQTATDALRSRLLAFSPLVLFLTIAMLWFVVGRAVRPVEELRRVVAGISPADLSARVAVPQADDEIRRLSLTMNDLLDRLEASSQRQARFVSDASHELRSPLAAVRTRLEVAIRAATRSRGTPAVPAPAGPGVPNWQIVASDVLRESMRMERLVADLLTLARRDAGYEPPPHSEIDLDEVVLHEAATARMLRTVTLDTSRVSAGRILGHADQLHRLCANLLDNATRHAVSRVQVTLGASSGGTGVELRVADDGPGIPEHDRARVFERFARLDEARNRHQGGTGLGLAIAREIATSHGGTLTVGTSDFGGAEFVASFPAAP